MTNNVIWLFVYNISDINKIKAESGNSADSLICSLAGEYSLSFSIMADTPLKILREDRGKPYFEGQDDLFFSISHSGEYWVCAFSRHPIGTDIQIICSCNYSAISRRFFHTDESVFLNRVSGDYFFDIWAAKESYVKYTGKGLSGEFASFSTVCGNSVADNINGTEIRFVDFKDDYKLCVCSDRIDDVKILSRV